jgi:hypothetical protein
MKISTKFFLDRQHVIKKLGEGRARSLRKAGAIVYRSCQGEMASGRPTTKGRNVEIGTFRGLPLIERRKRTSKPGRLTSWKTPRNSKGFMRQSMAFAYDQNTKTVVIGPRLNGWLNLLREKGGSQTQRLYLRYRGRPVPRQRAFGLKRTGQRFNLAYVGSFVAPRPSAASFVATARTRSVRVRADRFQAKGLQKVISKISKQFQGQIMGP